MENRYSYQEAALEAELIQSRRDQFGESFDEAEEHIDQDTQKVIETLKAAKERIEKRRTLLTELEDEEKSKRMAELKAVMFTRKEPEEAFHELSDEELALLEEQIEQYLTQRRLRVVDRNAVELIRSYRVIRHDLLTGEQGVTPSQFREASRQITGTIFKDILETQTLNPDQTVILMPWRAGLAFGEAAYQNGFRHFFHLGAKRNEETLETEIYYQEMPVLMTTDDPERNRHLQAIIADPMLATGNTMIDAVERLKILGIQEKNITIASVISAPEGIDHILSRFPDLKIVVGSHDEKLNSRGYITPGLGDFGDLHFAELSRQELEKWGNADILTSQAEQTLAKRMGLN